MKADGPTNPNVCVRNGTRTQTGHSIVDFEISGDGPIDNEHGRMSGGRARQAVERKARMSDCVNCSNDHRGKCCGSHPAITALIAIFSMVPAPLPNPRIAFLVGWLLRYCLHGIDRCCSSHRERPKHLLLCILSSLTSFFSPRHVFHSRQCPPVPRAP